MSYESVATDEEQGIRSSTGRDEQREELMMGEKQWLDVVDDQIRAGFARKVFGLVATQLAVTFGIIAFFTLNHSVKDYVDMRHPEGHSWPFITAMTVSIACILTLSCCANQARTHPNNIIFLSLFTIAEGVLLGVACAAFDVQAILLAVGVTAALVFGLVAYAVTTKTDFTGMGHWLFMSLWLLILYGIILGFFPYVPAAQVGYSAIGVVIFSVYLIHDVQLILGGKHARLRFSTDDYILAALTVYLDVINLFIRLLELLNRDR